MLSSRKRLRLYDDSDCGDETQSKARTVVKQGYHSGTTAVVGVLRENEFIVANAGDSKCVLASKGIHESVWQVDYSNYILCRSCY